MRDKIITIYSVDMFGTRYTHSIENIVSVVETEFELLIRYRKADGAYDGFRWPIENIERMVVRYKRGMK